MTINSKTTLKSIKAAVARDFGIVIDNASAKEIREDVRRGYALWTRERYVSSVTSNITHISRSRVQDCNLWYTRQEWNAQFSLSAPSGALS